MFIFGIQKCLTSFVRTAQFVHRPLEFLAPSLPFSNTIQSYCAQPVFLPQGASHTRIALLYLLALAGGHGLRLGGRFNPGCRGHPVAEPARLGERGSLHFLRHAGECGAGHWPGPGTGAGWGCALRRALAGSNPADHARTFL